MIRWPTRKDYDSALRNTSASFRSPEIQTSRVVHHGLGSIFSTGKFACISKVEIEGKFWALRFFLTDQPAIQDRYRAIQQMSDALRPYFVETHFFEDEIWVESQKRYFPVIKMEWVEGTTLGKFVHAACLNKDIIRLEWIRQELRELRQRLCDIQVSHGDLSTDNILISRSGTTEQVVLVDYDGVWLESIPDLTTSIGIGALQHPKRTNPTGPDSDAMAFEIFDLALAYLTDMPSTGEDLAQFDQRFLISVEDLLGHPSPVARMVESHLPIEFGRLVHYAAGPYASPPRWTSDQTTNMGSSESLPPQPKTSRAEREMKDGVTNIATFALTIGQDRWRVIRACTELWAGVWTGQSELDSDMQDSLRKHFENLPPGAWPSRDIPNASPKIAWSGTVTQLAQYSGVGTAQIRQILASLPSSVSGHFRLPHTNSRVFTVTDHEWAWFESRLDALRSSRARAPKPTPTPIVDTNSQPTDPSNLYVGVHWWHEHTVNSLSHSFGVTAGRLRDEIRWRRLSIQTFLPTLNETPFRLTEQQFQDITAIFRSETPGPPLNAGSKHGLHVSIRTLAARVNLPPGRLRTLLRQTSSLPELHRSMHDDVKVFVQWESLRAVEERIAEARAQRDRTDPLRREAENPYSGAPAASAPSTPLKKAKTTKSRAVSISSIAHQHSLTVAQLRDAIVGCGGIEGVTAVKNGKLSIAVGDYQMLVLGADALQEITAVAELARQRESDADKQVGPAKQNAVDLRPPKEGLRAVGLVIGVAVILRLVVIPLLT